MKTAKAKTSDLKTLDAKQVDAYRVFGLPYIVANLLFGLAAIPILIWLSRRYGPRLAGRPLLKRLADDLAGRNLSAALSYLESLAAYEDETAIP
jgi:hypothetical protein